MSRRKKFKKQSQINKVAGNQVPHERVNSRQNNVYNIAGFTMEKAKKGEKVRVLTSASIVSDDPIFHIFMEQIARIFLDKIDVNLVHHFLILIHKDSSFDLFVNDIPLRIEITSKRALSEGQMVRVDDIADVRKLTFDGLDVEPSDKIIYCFKVDWKFGLFFHLYGNDQLDVDLVKTELGALYRYLQFQYVYDTLESESEFDLLLKDGWFPFIEILGSEFKEIRDAYRNEPDTYSIMERVISKFDRERVNRISEKWWNKEAFSDKSELIKAGINSYLKDDKEGFINCIKNLLTEIDGIIRIHYFKETGKGDWVSFAELIEHVGNRGIIVSGSDLSLFLPSKFVSYLKDCIFQKFDLGAGEVNLSRNTSCHGVAKAEDYSKSRALQTILILDQLYYFL